MKVGTARARNSNRPPGMGVKRRRAVTAIRQERCTGGKSLRNREREGRGKMWVQRGREAASTGGRWGKIVDRSGGREKLEEKVGWRARLLVTISDRY